MRNRPDLTNQRFGKLVAKEYAGNDYNNCVLWLCICDCGNRKEIRAANLQTGNSKSCGCRKPYRIELAGRRFGMLTVNSYSYTDNQSGIMWDATCDCGTKTLVSGGHLRRGHTKSCGCFRSIASSSTTGKNGRNYKHGMNCGENTKDVIELKEVVK